MLSVKSLALLLAASPLGSADYLVLDVSPGDETCAPENSEASVMIQTDHCLKLPANVPLANSYKIESCSTGTDTISLTLNVFTTSNCDSNGITQEFTFDSLPSSCINGTKLSCQTSDPYAVVQNWPAFGMYVDDSSCAMPTLVAAIAPNCNTYSFQGISFSTDLVCSDTAGASFSLYGTNDSIPYNECSGEPSEYRSMIADQCTSFANMEPITLPDVGDIIDGSLKDIFDQLQLDSSDLYYYADCGGANNIPGIETNANSGSTSDSEDSVSAGMIALYAIVGGLAGLGLLVGGFLYMRRKAGDSQRGEAINDDLLEKDNIM